MDEEQRPAAEKPSGSPARRPPRRGKSLVAAVPRHLLAALAAGVRDALAAFPRLLAKLSLPAVGAALAGRFGLPRALEHLARAALSPFDLPGSAFYVLLAAVFIDLYAALAVGAALFLDLREATILAVMCLAAHDLRRETEAMRRAGSSSSQMVVLRLALALASGYLLARMLPASLSSSPRSLGSLALPFDAPLLSALGPWILRFAGFSAALAVFVLCLSVGKRLFAACRGVDILARLAAPLMRFFGLSARDARLLAAADVLGYDYASRLAAADIEAGRIKQQDGDLFNHHAAASHALVEETLLLWFAGLPLFWLVVPRLVGAAALVWLERFRRHYFRRSFRAGIG